MDWYSKQLTQVEKELNTNFDTGLTSQQARERLERDGLNKLNEKPPKTFLQRLKIELHLDNTKKGLT